MCCTSLWNGGTKKSRNVIKIPGRKKSRLGYRDRVTAFRVAKLVILNAELPQSLRACYDRLIATFEAPGNPRSVERRLAGLRHASLKFARMEQIFNDGLHEFLVEFIDGNAEIGQRFSRDFMMTRRSCNAHPDFSPHDLPLCSCAGIPGAAAAAHAANRSGQSILDRTIDSRGELNSWTDGFGNACNLLTLDRSSDCIVITAAGEVMTTNPNGATSAAGSDLPLAVFLRQSVRTSPDAAMIDFTAGFDARLSADRRSGLDRLMAAIRERVRYQLGVTHAHSTAAESFAEGKGVCQDHTHMFIGCARQAGVPARYVLGHLHNGDHAGSFDAGHAWAEAWIDGLGRVRRGEWHAIVRTPCRRRCGARLRFGVAGAGDARRRHGRRDAGGFGLRQGRLTRVPEAGYCRAPAAPERRAAGAAGRRRPDFHGLFPRVSGVLQLAALRAT